jgi:membrane protein YdbS with pleckstrin-like domain
VKPLAGARLRTALLDLLLVGVVAYTIAFYVFDLPYWLRVSAGIIGVVAVVAFPIVTYIRSRGEDPGSR